ncbi:MAG: acetylxylan esterase [Candidatus Acetothermia bacterium]|jgi:tetratricopeptide (TPR) repeat protein|nr:acetylxylan esterase [Candidatus Acetothermia bacterium]
MIEPTWEDLRRAIFRLYGEARYREALAYARQAAARFPEHEARTAYWTACFLCRVGEPEEALRTLEEAHARGHWWGEGLLTKDPDLEPLRAHPGFDRVLASCRESQRRAQATAQSQARVLFPEGEALPRRSPLLLVLHGRGGSAEEYAPHFRSATAQGWIVALAQGTQLEGEGMYTWDDRDLAEREVASLWRDVARSHPVDEERVALAGASQGGALAIAWALAGLVCRLEVVPGLGHELPDDFPQRLPAALAFVAGA